MDKNNKIIVTGNRGLVGSATVRGLGDRGYKNIFTIDKCDYDLRNYNSVHYLWEAIRPDYVINCAAHVGGLLANIIKSGKLLYDNLMIQTNVIECSRIFGVKKLLQIGSSSCYPQQCPLPIKEEYLLSSPLSESDMGYSIAKISGILMCRLYHRQYGCNFISVMPANIYGINDNFNIEDSRVIASIIKKVYDAMINNIKSIEFRGTGLSRREFLFVDDFIDALFFLMDNYDEESHINIGTGENISIVGVVGLIVDIMGYKGEIIWNNNYSDGVPCKLLDVSKIRVLGWEYKTSLETGLKITIDWFKKNQNIIRL